MPKTTYVPFNRIKTPQDIVYMNVAEDYKQKLSRGDCIDPVEVLPEGDGFLLSDGNHRCMAALEIGKNGINAVVLYSHSGRVTGCRKSIGESEKVSNKTKGIILPEFR